MNGKRILKYTGLALFGAAVVVLPILAVSNSLTQQTAFSSDKIGLYVEKAWRPTYEKAIRKYKEKYPDWKYDIQLLELGSFDAVGLVDTLGFADQKVADIIYTPVDRIPALVQNSQAIMGFNSVDSLITEEFDEKIYQGIGKDAFAAKGEALVVPPNGEEGDNEPKPFYFGIPHSTEALVLYYKGFSQDELSSIEKIAETVNNNNWTDSMFSLKFNDLWYALGLIAGFLDAEQAGAGSNGQLVGKVLVSKTTTSTKYQSNMENIDGANNTLEDFSNTPGWDDKGKSLSTKQATDALTKAINFLGKFYNSTKVKNNLLGTNNNEWLLNGDDFSPKTTQLLDNPKTKKAAAIDGPWMVSQYNGKFTNAIAVPNVTDGVSYLQAPGGWLYAINQRNATNKDKIRDIKRFINILLSDDEIINDQYTYCGKMVEGQIAKGILEEFANNNIDNPDKQLEASVIKAVYASKTMDKRPDGGNAEFNQVWGAWDEQGFRSTAGKNIRNILVSRTDLTTEQVQAELRQSLVTSFTAMLIGLRGK